MCKICGVFFQSNLYELQVPGYSFIDGDNILGKFYGLR